MSADMTTMPFGKHKGKPFDQLDLGYMEWLLANTELRPPLKAIITLEVSRRGSGKTRPSPAAQRDDDDEGYGGPIGFGDDVRSEPAAVVGGDSLREVVREEIAMVLRRMLGALEGPR